VQELDAAAHADGNIIGEIPTGVIPSRETESISRVIPRRKMLGENAKQAENFAQLLGEEAADPSLLIAARSLGTVSQELEFTVAGRLLHAAVTVSSLGPSRSNRGYW